MKTEPCVVMTAVDAGQGNYRPCCKYLFSSKRLCEKYEIEVLIFMRF